MSEQEYQVVVQLVVRVKIFATSRALAVQKVEDMMAGTQCWQAWGKGLSTDAITWVDGYPIIVSAT